MQLMSKNQGWDPTEIAGDAYDAEKGNALRWSKGYGDQAGPDSPAGDVSVGPDDTQGVQYATLDERKPGTGVKRENAARHYPGKPL